MNGFALHGNELSAVELGAAVVVGPSARPSGFAVRLAQAMVPDPGRWNVVPDAGDGPWPQDRLSLLADLLRGRGPVRLALPGAGAGRPVPPAQWLADRLGTEIVAPDGPLAPVGRRMVYVVGVGGAGTWAAFRPGQPPVALGPRFPAPRWERDLPRGRALTGGVEAIPAGLWVHGGRHDPASRSGLFDVPCLPDVVTVAVGCPGAAQPAVPDFVALRQSVPLLASPAVRIVPYWYGSARAVGQELADRLRERVVTTVGVPGEGALLLRDDKGASTWETFALDVAYLPDGAPTVTRWRPPVPGLPPAGPAGPVFRFGDDVVVEVVQSGLWLRGAGQPVSAQVRALPADPEWARLTVGVPGTSTSDALMTAASTLTARLDQRCRHYLRLAVEGVAAPSAQPREQTTIENPPEPAEEPKRERTVAYPVVDPRHRSTPEEQSWLLEHLGHRYGRHSSAAVRMVAGQPALRLLADAPRNAVVADLVAVSAYLAEGRDEIESALAQGRVDTVVPYLRCVVSGLRRLPSYRGVAYASAAPDVPAVAGAVWTDTEIRQAVVTADAALAGPAEYVIWSTTGRRLDALVSDDSVRRVAFAPGSRFQVLDPGTPDAAVRQILLRDVTTALPGGPADTVLERLAAAARRRQAVPPGDRLSAPDPDALSWHTAAEHSVTAPPNVEPVGAPGGPIPTTGGRRPAQPAPDHSASWDAGSAEFLPFLTREG